jgi:hypothetical protein
MKIVPMLLLVATLVGLAPAQAQDAPSPAGYYAADIRETATGIMLTEDGRFAWYFSTGALDQVAEGRWHLAEHGSVLLDNDPPYNPPRFELVGTSRDERPGVFVRLDSDSRNQAAYLDVEPEFSDGSRVRQPLRPNGVRLADAAGRPPAAVRLGSLAFDFQSDPFPVSAEAGNVMTFRFLPNEIGRADFSGRRVTLEPDGLSFEWRGTTLHYARAELPPDTLANMERLDPADIEMAEIQGTEIDRLGTEMATYADAQSQDSGELVAYGPVQPWEVPEGAPSVGLYHIELGEPYETTAARGTFPFRPDAGLGNDFARGVAEARIRFGGIAYDAGRVSNLSWYVNERDGAPYIKAVGFSHQDRLLAIGEALARARAVQAWLVQVGFTPGGPEEADERPPFSLIDPYRYDEQVAGWDEAEALLADEEAGIQGLDLFQMRARGWYATVP